MLLRQTILYLPAQFLGPLTQFLSVIVWTHWLSPAEFGVLMLVSVTHELAYAVTLSWFSLYAVRYIPDRKDERKRRKFYQTETTMLGLSSLFSMAAALILLYFILDDTPSLVTIAVTLFFFVTRSANLHYAERARADEEIGHYTQLQTIGPVVGFVLGLLLMSAWEATPTAVIAGYGLAQAVALLFVLPRLGFSLKITRPDGKMVNDSVRYGSPIMIANWLTWFSDHGIRFIVRYGLDMAAVGLLSVPWGLGRRSAAFTANLVNAAAFPLAVKKLKGGSRDDAMIQLSTNGALLVGVLAPTVAGIWAINELLVRTLIDVRFQEVTITLLPLAVLAGGIRNLRAHYPDQIFLLDGNTGKLLKIDMIESVAVLIFCGLGLWFYGLTGAVAGATAGALAGVGASFAYANAVGGFQILWTDISRIILACMVMVVVLKLIALPMTMLGLVASVVLGAVVYGLVLAPFYYREAVGTFRSFLVS